jgi:transcriptional regulator with XRE-family HTH domain
MALARRGRRISSEDLAERMGVSRGTLRRLEQGDPGIALNTLAMALSALGMLDRLTDLIAQSTDDIGLMIARENLGKRVGRARLSNKVVSSPSGDDRDSSEPEAW